MTRFPDLFIVGAPKSGTTSLYDYLKSHPQVFMPDFKEPCYFARDLALDESGSFLVYGRDEEQYLDLFAGAGDAKRAGEGSTRYLYSLDAAQLIHDAQPDAFVIACVRNPVDMIHSLYVHKLAADTEDAPTFEDALALEDERHAGRRLPAHSNPRLSTYRDRAMFGAQLARWIEIFGRERVKVVVLEDMIRDPAGEFEAVLDFLGVDPTYRPESFAVRNAAHASRSRTLRRLATGRPAKWFTWQLMPRLVGQERTRSLVQRLRESRLNRRKIKRTPVAPELRRRLEDEFRPDVARLSELLGRDLAALWFGDAPAEPGKVVDSSPLTAAR